MNPSTPRWIPTPPALPGGSQPPSTAQPCVPVPSPAPVPPGSVPKAAVATWAHSQLQRCPCLAPAGLRSTEVTQGQCRAEFTVNSEEIPGLELCTPSFVICPECFFSLGSDPAGLEALFAFRPCIFCIPPSDLVLELWRSPRHGAPAHPRRAQRLSASRREPCHPVSPAIILSMRHIPSLPSTQAPRDGALGSPQETMAGSWKLGLQSKKGFLF